MVVVVVFRRFFSSVKFTQKKYSAKNKNPEKSRGLGGFGFMPRFLFGGIKARASPGSY